MGQALTTQEIERAAPPSPQTSFNVKLMSYEDFPGWLASMANINRGLAAGEMR